jgi:hypothetical protein
MDEPVLSARIAETIAFLQTLNDGEPRRKTIDTADKSALRQTMRSGKLK